MAFLIDSLKKKFENKEEEVKFNDMNYIVGNTSGLDIGQVPGPLDQRIGRMAQIGGSLMEIQISNPATFQIDRPEVINVVNQLGLKMTLHGDPNMGFTAAYATGGRVTGYNIVHRYFKRYLEQMASFKYEVEKREDTDFKVGYVNMHASNEMIPALEERMASDVSVDPFGEFITDINGEKNPNIYRNKDFLEKLFDFWFLPKVENPYQYYRDTFANNCDAFQKKWNEAKKISANNFFNELDRNEDIIAVMQTAISADQGLIKSFLNNLDKELEKPIVVEGSKLDPENPEDRLRARQKVFNRGNHETPGEITEEEVDEEIELFNRSSQDIEFRTLKDISKLSVPGRGRIFNNPRTISRDLHELEQGAEGELTLNGESDEDLREVIAAEKDNIEDKLVELLIELWDASSADARKSALVQNIGIGRFEIEENAQNLDIAEDAARKTFCGDRDFYGDGYWVENREGEKPKYMKILESMSQGPLSNELNKESSIYFHIMPAWMMSSDYTDDEADNHEGWDAPKFIWEKIVGRSDFKSYKDFRRWLNEKRENQLNVISAVGACYLWGHFTQKEDVFEKDVFNEKYAPEFEEWDAERAGENQLKETWIEWMNRFKLKVNIEAMYGSPGELRRLWRPKDIAIACRAINKTAENKLGDAYDESLLKFTIDMEHTASYGVDPVREMEELAKQEDKLAKEIDSIDEEKPLADIVKTYHLTKPGWEQQSGHRHGPFARGDRTLYSWLYYLVKNGFARDDDDPGIVMFEVGGEYREEIYVIKVAMDMIQHGIKPEDLDANKVPVDGDFETVEQELMARFFGMDKGSYHREWAKVEEHAFDPLDGLLQAEGFDNTYSGSGAIEQGGNRPMEWKSEEYK